MLIEELTKERLDAAIAEKGIVLIDCWAPWCQSCLDFGPVFETVSRQFPDQVFAKLNTQREQELVKQLGVVQVPTLILFRDGIMVLRQPGYFDQEELVGVVQQAEKLDMDAVRARMQSQEGQPN